MAEEPDFTTQAAELYQRVIRLGASDEQCLDELVSFARSAFELGRSQRWIPCSPGSMPEEGVTVNYLCAGRVRLGENVHGVWRWELGTDASGYVTHWAPLPPLPSIQEVP